MSEGTSGVGGALEQVAADIGRWAGAELASVRASVDRKASVAIMGALAGIVAIVGVVLIVVGAYISLESVWPAWAAGLVTGGVLLVLALALWLVGVFFVGRYQKRLADQRAALAQRLVRSDFNQISALVGGLKDEKIALAAGAALLAGLMAGRRSG